LLEDGFDALLDVLLNSNLSISLPVGPDFDVLPSALEHLSERYQQEIVHISDHDSLTLPFPAGLSLTIAFPADVDANGSVTDPLSACVTTGVHGVPTTGSWPGPHTGPLSFTTVYVDVSCPDAH